MSSICYGLFLIPLLFGNISYLNSYYYEVIGVLIFTIYHFHFVSTFYLQKERKILYTKIFFFLFLLIGSAFYFLPKDNIVAHILLFFTLVGLLYHFGMQTAGLIKNQSRQVKILLVTQCFVGMLYYLSHYRVISFFDLKLYIPFNLNQAICLLLVFFVAFLNVCNAVVYYFKNRRLDKTILWFSHIFIWCYPEILLKNFHLIPLFHAIQYIPHYINKIKVMKFPVITTLGILLFSFIFLSFLPNFLDQNKYTFVSGRPYFYITVFALIFNLHHFLVDTITGLSSYSATEIT